MFKKLFSIDLESQDLHFDKVKLARTINYFNMFILLFFAILHAVFFPNLPLIAVKIFFFFATLALLLWHKKTHQDALFIKATTILIFLASISYFIVIEKEIFSSTWLFFFPFIAFLLNDLEYAKKWVIAYYIILSSYIYYGIGRFTNIIDFLYFTFSLAFFIYFFYQFELSRREAYAERSSTLQKLHMLSMIDSLTNLYNRHFLNKHILQNKALTSKPFLFCITDIDNFKLYNDTYGHQKGDDVIKTIADVKKLCMENKSDSFVFRLGGEEFGAFIFNEQNAKEKVETFLQKVRNLEIEHKNNPPYFICTVSIGAVVCHQHDGFDFSKVYQLADEALYDAKKSGKNRIVYKEYLKEVTH